jgi:hypothetical protein
MRTIIPGIFLLALLYFSRCSTEVDIYADYKDITIVYAILDYSDDTTWVKITKAFAGPGNALEIAQIPDSSNYPFKLDVRLQGVRQGQDLEPLLFDTLTITNKRAGDSIFYFPNQLMYYAVGELDPEASYTLSVFIGEREINSETQMVKNFAITRPRNRISFIGPQGEPADGTIEWNSAENGKRYESFYVFNYQELRPGESDTLDLTVTWFLDSQQSIDTDGGENMEERYSGEAFYGRLEDDLADIEDVKRWAGTVDLYIAAGNQELQNYIAINASQGSLLDEVPVYTNINNGIGIFASRHTVSRSVELSTNSLSYLVEGTDLGFLYPTEK